MRSDAPRLLLLLLSLTVTANALEYAHAKGKWITVEATAYCPCEICCDTRTETTANQTSTNAVPYGVAASPDIRLGTRVFVPEGIGYLDATLRGDRWLVADDRGGALRTEWRRSGITRIDLRYKTHASAKAFGRKFIVVFIEGGK